MISCLAKKLGVGFIQRIAKIGVVQCRPVATNRFFSTKTDPSSVDEKLQVLIKNSKKMIKIQQYHIKFSKKADAFHSTSTMEVQAFEYDPKDVVETAQGNKIHKQCSAHGSQNIMLNGSSILLKDVIVRGDMAQIRMGKFCIVGERTVIRPSYKEFQKGATYFHSNVGDHVMIEEDCVIEAVQIGSYVHIGAGSVIGNGVIVKDCSIILPKSVIPPNQIVPPFTVFAGNPAKKIADAPETTQLLMTHATCKIYMEYVGILREKYDDEIKQEIEQLKQIQEETSMLK